MGCLGFISIRLNCFITFNLNKQPFFCFSLSTPSLALKYKYCIRLIPVDVMGFKFPKNNLTLLDKHTIWHLGLEEAGGWAWNYSFWVFRQIQKLRNIMCYFCSVCGQDLFSFVSLFLILLGKLTEQKQFPLILIHHFIVFYQYIITVYCDAIWKASKCCLWFFSKSSLGWQAIASRFGKDIIMSAWLADY